MFLFSLVYIQQQKEERRGEREVLNDTVGIDLPVAYRKWRIL